MADLLLPRRWHGEHDDHVDSMAFFAMTLPPVKKRRWSLTIIAMLATFTVGFVGGYLWALHVG